ncbi:MAG: fibronectin type III domain-containing protein [Dehalococcoidia bacterium]|nr:fibronectin type III domain-containing protein [Dehalococcoidia bacterium]
MRFPTLPSNLRLNSRLFSLLVGFLIATLVAVLMSTTATGVRALEDPVTGVNIAPGTESGQIVITWSEPSEQPENYRVSWAPEGEGFKKLAANEGNAFVTEARYVVNDLTPGARYKAKVRARFTDGRKSAWSEVAYGEAASEQSKKDSSEQAIAPRQQQQVQVPIPTTSDECGDQVADGTATSCAANSFGITTMRDGGVYHMDWTEWHNRNADRLEHYTIQRLIFTYNFNIRHALDNTPADIGGTPGVSLVLPDTCVPVAVADSLGSLSHFEWSCDGLSNIRQDIDGNVTAPETLVDSALNWQTPYLSGTIARPGFHRDTPLTGMRIPARQPTDRDDQPTAAEAADTVELEADAVEMRLYLITAHFNDGTSYSRHMLVHG